MELQTLYKELSQEQFNCDAYVESLARKANTANPKSPLDSIASAFKDVSSDLKVLDMHLKKKERLIEEACRKVEGEHWEMVALLLEKNEKASEILSNLTKRFTNISSGVTFLGYGLAKADEPRSRLVEKQELIKYFAEFLSGGQPLSDVISNKTKQFEAAKAIQQLSLIAEELPKNEYGNVRKNIMKTYNDIERILIGEFVSALETGNISRMKEVANVLSPFRGYSDCVSAYIEHSQRGAFVGRDIFFDVKSLSEKNAVTIREIFHNPEHVMARFILNLYTDRLLKYIEDRLSDRSDPERYLATLFEMHTRVTNLSDELSRLELVSDSSYLATLRGKIFQSYLETYPRIEEEYLQTKFRLILDKFYSSKGHEKRQFSGISTISELKREVQAAITAKTNIQFSSSDLSSRGEILLSEEAVVIILQESKQALKRCHVLSYPNKRIEAIASHSELLLEAILSNHLNYALDIGIQSIPLSEFPKGAQPPQITFYDTVHLGTNIVHLLGKHLADVVLPMIRGSAYEEQVMDRKEAIVTSLEGKFQMGLDRSISAIIGWIRSTLQNEQRKADFKPENDDQLAMPTPVCLKVSRFMEREIGKIKTSLDGRNLEAVLTEVGIRFHRTIYDHLQQFQFNSAGAVNAMLDVSEYRKVIDSWKMPSVLAYFDALYALCNLLVVRPDNLRQVRSGELLAALDNSIILSFVQLRTDFKTSKLFQNL
ncbi:exocyst complex component 5-like isoform X4 [Artemia franciscana]|nr:hypothetical protein QYM36_016767 [Artemia franciscana]KAK2704480.1 hypothetical protein QYM36_016767 [Artemia franciscana]KAK2704481.1 hypothetical protein QYM36_016767 [Artemia franciscana]